LGFAVAPIWPADHRFGPQVLYLPVPIEGRPTEKLASGKNKDKSNRVTFPFDLGLKQAKALAEEARLRIVLGGKPLDEIGQRRAASDGLTLRQAWALYQQAMKKLGRSDKSKKDYQYKIDRHLSAWLDRPLIDITREACNTRHTEIGEKNGTYMANGVMRVLRAIWRRAMREHSELPVSPTINVDFYPEKGREAVITDWPAWWEGIQKIESPARQDFYTWLAFTGCRAGETMTMAWENVDLDKGLVLFPITKTDKLELPLSDFLTKFLRRRKEHVTKEFGARCKWVFPSGGAKTGHVDGKLTPKEAALFKEDWSPHTLRHSWITIADQKVKISDAHQRALTNHKPKRSKNGDAHAGYIHPDIEDIRKSQQRMTNHIRQLIEPKPIPKFRPSRAG
jgi:integrase